MIPNPGTFRYAHDEKAGVATITLDRPDRLNALTFEIYAELRDAFRVLDTEETVRAIVVTGAGRGFCSGGDVDEIIRPLLDRDAQGLLDFTRMTCDLIFAIRRCRRPVIAAVNGTATGAGAVIATACDVRVASESARIAYLFTRVGLSGADMGAAWLLPRIVGLGKASELLMTGDFVDAHEAKRIGLFDRIVPDGRSLAEARALAERLAHGPAASIAATKRALEAEAAMGLEEALEREARVQAERMLHPDFREGYEAFVENREPEFE